MGINKKIKAAAEPVVPVCVPELYAGEETEYCTFNYTALPTCFADGAPQLVRYLVQLHWFLPSGRNPMKKKELLQRALFDAGFSFPETIDASDEESQHYVFETECLDGMWPEG